MSIGDVVLGLAGLYLLRQQNQIFREQNQIFAVQSGATVPSEHPPTIPKLRRYWPMLVMTILVLLVWAPIGYNYYDRQVHGSSATAPPDSPFAPWLLLVGILLIFGHDLYLRSKGRSLQTSHETQRNIALLAHAPRIRVDYIDTGQKGVLEFKSDKPSTVRRVRPLLSREHYETEHEFSLIPSPPLSVDANSPIKCKITGLRRQNSPDFNSLVDILRAGTEQSLNSVLIDYDDDHGNEFSRRFDLKRSQDGSIAWISSPSVDLKGQTQIPEPTRQDLAELWRQKQWAANYPEERTSALQYATELEANAKRFHVLTTAFHDLTAVGQLQLLAEEVEYLESRLNQIIMENSVDGQPIDLSRPLSSEVITIDSVSNSSIPWQQRSMMALRDRYEVHRYRVTNRSAFQCRVMPPNTPSNLTKEQWSTILSDHRKALIEKAQELAKRHLEALSGNPQ